MAMGTLVVTQHLPACRQGDDGLAGSWKVPIGLFPHTLSIRNALREVVVMIARPQV